MVGAGGGRGAGALRPLRAALPGQLPQPRGGGRAAGVPCAAAAEERSCGPRQARARRTSSLDAVVGSYLLGQWPRDGEGASALCVSDKATQTPGSWPGAGRGGGSAHGRSASWGSVDRRREIARMKQQLQRTKLNGRSCKEKKSSPLPGDHAVLGSLRDPPSSFPSPLPALRLSPCLHRSLEGLNQELEEVFVKERGGEELLRILDVPDGHRAPAPAPALEPSSCSSRSLSPSPSALSRSPRSPRTPARAAAAEPSPAASGAQPRPKEKEERSPSPVPAFAASPRPNHSFVFNREPPEGCERVRASEEASSPSPAGTFQPRCPDKNKVHFNPTGSAFCPVSLEPPLLPRLGFHFGGSPASPSPGAGALVPCRPPAPSPLGGARQDAAVAAFPAASQPPSLGHERWKRGPPELSGAARGSLVA